MVCSRQQQQLQHLNRRDALKGTTASVAQIALTPAVATAAASEKLALPKMGIGAWAWGDSLFWGYDPKEDEELEKVFSFVAARKDGFVDTAELYGIGRSNLWSDSSRSATAR